ncbi:Acetoin catabolism regulatory protein [Cupriavidus yeoncheonensis]|uniref:Acetoin catabolism regulatory protein n=1 Tax=Cupriavidus yeoncheonensis TaxID=1462994 RepID=A0A916NG03_9BURK|nr:sigma-54-dependent Fis family transcriptional regulator [Cupriavidus yeoncheonensis]CAG2156781.1 Acetoin catabolism regulatory protein [Cupriavidus yeoncheonensis]
MPLASSALAGDARTARRDFLDGKDLPAGMVPDAILRSWQRAAQSGVRPDQRVLFSDIVTRSQWRRAEEENRALIEMAGADMEILAGAFPSRHWIVLCTNAQGTIVASHGRLDGGASGPSPLQHGRQLDEDGIGTNAPGCVLEDGGGPGAEIRRGEHYLHELVDVVCAAAPILDCHDRLIGVLDVTGFGVDLPRYALSRVQAAALSIGNRTFEQLPGCRVVRLHHDYRMLQTPVEGVIALSDDGVVVAANRAARQMLHLSGAELGVADIGTLFVGGLRGPGGSVPAMVHTPAGERLHVAAADAASKRVVSYPGTASPAPGAPQVIADATLGRVYGKAIMAVREQVPLILLGETGTGKSMLARALHDASRPDGGFVSLNCSAIPEGLVEAELFGYADGAFTGGRKGGSAGKIEQANHGTLFLDEIGDMPLSLQTRLLSVLQERSVTRVGAGKPIAVDISVVCATHRNLAELVRAGVFREDLFFRLNGMSVRIPALRERTDLPELIDSTLATLARGRRKFLDADVMALLMSHAWPGNVRELHQVLRTAVALSGDSAQIRREHLDESWLESVIDKGVAEVPPEAGHPTRLADVESQMIERTLAELGGNRSRAAKALGISRATLYRKLAQGKGQ